MATLGKSYTSRYIADQRISIYPVEFVVRAFLGTYPDLQMPRNEYEGKKVLDLGYGDGRNMPLLHDLGFSVFGVEIADDINNHAQARLSSLGVEAELKTGKNHHIPYDNSFFDYVLACHSCYYIESGTSFEDNLAEIARVLQVDGYFIASLPMTDTYILQDASFLGDGYYKISRDPYNLRNGTVFRAFSQEEEICNAFSPLYKNFCIGFCDDFFWGIRQKVWIIVCQKK